MSKIIGYIKRHKILSTIAVVVVLGIGYSIFKPTPPVERDVITAAKTTVVQEVEVTGRVESSEKIDLAVESGGKVRTVNAKVGDKVTAGQLLLKVDDSDLQIRLGRQQAALRRAQIAVEELENPSGSLAGLETENSLAQAMEAKTTAEIDLEKAYEDGFNAVSDAFLDLPGAIASLDRILGQNYLSHNTVTMLYGREGQDFREDALAADVKAEDIYDDVLAEYRTASRQSSKSVIEGLISRTYDAAKTTSDAIKVLNNLLDFVERESEDSTEPNGLDGDQAELDTLTAQINGHLSGLLGITNDLKGAREDLVNAEREIKEREQAAVDFFKGTDLERARLDVRQAGLDIQDTAVQINERSVRSPIAGTVTEVNARVGELIPSGFAAAAVISESMFQVKANLPESDVSKIAVGADADIILDTYGSDVVFKARVVAIDPAETVVDGVAVYGMTLEFEQQDERIKSGLTADVTVKGERREDVMAVPQRAVITRNGTKYVQILEGENVIERVVETGLRGSDGNIEITQGLQGGEQVIVFVQE